MELQRDISLEKNLKKVGSIITAIIEEIADGEYVGRTEFDAPEVDGEIFIKSDKPLNIGDIVKVKVTEAYEYDIAGIVI